jgi:uncharacterized protein YoxC
MEVATAIFNIGVGVGLVLVGAALLVLAVASVPLLMESRALVADSRRLAALADSELRPILVSARELTSNVEVLSEDAAVKLDRLSDMMNALQQTLETVQVTAKPRRSPVRSVESSDAREE